MIKTLVVSAPKRNPWPLEIHLKTHLKPSAIACLALFALIEASAAERVDQQGETFFGPITCPDAQPVGYFEAIRKNGGWELEREAMQQCGLQGRFVPGAIANGILRLQPGRDNLTRRSLGIVRTPERGIPISFIDYSLSSTQQQIAGQAAVGGAVLRANVTRSDWDGRTQVQEAFYQTGRVRVGTFFSNTTFGRLHGIEVDAQNEPIFSPTEVAIPGAQRLRVETAHGSSYQTLRAGVYQVQDLLSGQAHARLYSDDKRIGESRPGHRPGFVIGQVETRGQGSSFVAAISGNLLDTPKAQVHATAGIGLLALRANASINQRAHLHVQYRRTAASESFDVSASASFQSVSFGASYSESRNGRWESRTTRLSASHNSGLHASISEDIRGQQTKMLGYRTGFTVGGRWADASVTLTQQSGASRPAVVASLNIPLGGRVTSRTRFENEAFRQALEFGQFGDRLRAVVSENSAFVRAPLGLIADATLTWDGQRVSPGIEGRVVFGGGTVQMVPQPGSGGNAILEIVGPPGATVRLNGQPAGTLPASGTGVFGTSPNVRVEIDETETEYALTTSNSVSKFLAPNEKHRLEFEFQPM